MANDFAFKTFSDAIKGIVRPMIKETRGFEAVVASDGEVLVEGNGEPVPVASTTVDMVPGQTVKVENIDGELHVIGNLSNPSTDDSTANKARAEAAEAGKTATNYMDLTTDEGLVVGNMTGGELGGNVQLTAEPSVNLRSGKTIIAKFGAALDSGYAYVNLLKGKLKIATKYDGTWDGTYSEISSNRDIRICANLDATADDDQEGVGLTATDARDTFYDGTPNTHPYNTLKVQDWRTIICSQGRERKQYCETIFDYGGISTLGSVSTDGGIFGGYFQVCDHSSPIGSFISVSGTITPASGAGAWGTWAYGSNNITLPAGTWVITLDVTKIASGTGIFAFRICQGSTKLAEQRLNVTTDNETDHNVTRIVTPTESTTYRTSMMQNSTTYKSHSYYLRAVRIA